MNTADCFTPRITQSRPDRTVPAPLRVVGDSVTLRPADILSCRCPSPPLKGFSFGLELIAGVDKRRRAVYSDLDGLACFG
ncbi:hypothetical protein BaRGS_00009311 [Batillaria attramentaria]|uniref:Uncharacterized protein n=1 Tax=Batillaria attramentaria TaxID=370345 RepID=A0ABD0LJH0_9CAEN